MRAEQAGDLRTALQGVREARASIELLARLDGELSQRTTVQVLIASPEWLATRAAIVNALRPYPDASEAVSGALQQIEAGHE